MRSISKIGKGGHHLALVHASPPKTAKQATTRWSGFGHKPALLQNILQEQYQLCCYSELRADQEGLGYHVEHVVNKSQNPSRTFDYKNLAASALKSDPDLEAFKAQAIEVFGGHAPLKQAAYDLNRFVSCYQKDCRRFFVYLSDGRVVPSQKLREKNRDRAKYTIDTLNLNSGYLVTRRRQWWDELDELHQTHIAQGWSLYDLAAIDLVPTNNRLSRFFTLTRQFFGHDAEDALEQYAPELL